MKSDEKRQDAKDAKKSWNEASAPLLSLVVLTLALLASWRFAILFVIKEFP
jgi:hypothetical protein